MQGASAVNEVVDALARPRRATPTSTSSSSPAAAAASRTCSRSATSRWCARCPPPGRRWSARSATRATGRCSIWSPTSPRPRPTDAAKHLVPDLAAELHAVAELRDAGPQQRPGPARPRARADERAARTAAAHGARPPRPRVRGRRAVAQPRPHPPHRADRVGPGRPRARPGPGHVRCPRRPPSSAATRSCAAPTAAWCARPARPGGPLRVRVAGGEFAAVATDGSVPSP